MAAVREILKRDIGVQVEGVVKVFDQAALSTEIREYVVTDKLEEEFKRVFDTFTQVSETLRRGAPGRDVMGIWVSGFFGSGKSHFAKILGHLLQNSSLDERGDERCTDVFVKHLSDTPRGRDIRLRLAELKRHTDVRMIAFEIRSRKSLTNPDSVGLILLSELYRSIGLAENFAVARLERRFEERGLLEKLAAAYEAEFRTPWLSPQGRDDLTTLRRRLARLLPKVDPKEYPDEKTAKDAVGDALDRERVTAEDVARELVSWVDREERSGGKSIHLVFVIDEVGTFIGDSNEKIGELNSIAEMIGNKGKGKVWLIATSQQDLEKVVDRTNFQPALVGRLNARFELKPHLISDEINRVVSERILKKRPAEEGVLRRLYQENEGHIARLADLKATRDLGVPTERSFVDAYPFFPHQIRLAQDIFEALSGFRVSGGVRSMISVVMGALQQVAGEEVGVIVSFDRIFDAVENDLRSQEYLGASGVREIAESGQRVPGTPIPAARVLKVLWLLKHVTWVPRVPETLAKLLVRDLATDIPALRNDVETTLKSLQDAGYVGCDEATGEWKGLSDKERTIEQAIQEMVRPGGPRGISLATVRRVSQQICRADLLAKNLGGFAVPYGRTKVPFDYGVSLDGEAVESGADLEVQFISPLAPGRGQEMEEARRRNQSAGAKGRHVVWAARVPDALEARLKRYEALDKVTSDKRFVDDASASTQDALAEKRKERDQLRGALVRDLEGAFLGGTVLYGGQEIQLDGAANLKEPIAKALTSVIPNIYSRFAIADRAIDFARQLKAILNPATSALHEVAPELDLFDTRGSLQRESSLVSQVLEVIRDLADEGTEPAGALLLDAGDRKGFQGFARPPFRWPDELVRVVLAACFRAGAVYLERQSGSGPSPLYDYRGSDETFTKITAFRKVLFRVAETCLSIEQIKEAARSLAALGVSGVPESGNAIAAAIREVGTRIKTGLQEAASHEREGLPLPAAMPGAEPALAEPMTARDPTAAVTAYLAVKGEWKTLHKGLEGLRAFVEAGRHQELKASRELDRIVRMHPLPEPDPRSAKLEEALRDMAAVIEAREVLTRWPDYREASERAFSLYRDAYAAAYENVRAESEAALGALRGREAYLQAPAPGRDDLVAKVFGEGRMFHYPPLALPTVSRLLEAASRRSLTSLAQALVALPGYGARTEAELRDFTAPPPAAGEKIYEWHLTRLLGRRFKTEAEVEAALAEAADEIKRRLREGFTVVVR